MSYYAGIDIGSTYVKSIIIDASQTIVSRSMQKTGYKITQAGGECLDAALTSASLSRDQIAYSIVTGYGRHLLPFSDAHVTDLTAAAKGAAAFFPGTTTVLDIGGQTMKATKLDDKGKVKAFRLNDKCAAGTGAFLEKTAFYMGYQTADIGPLLVTAKHDVPISGVCAVFAESEVINQLNLGSAPADIMLGAINSLTKRSMQLLRRIKMEPEYTLIGGILRWETMVNVISKSLGAPANVPQGDLPQYTSAYGAAILGKGRYEKQQGSA